MPWGKFSKGGIVFGILLGIAAIAVLKHKAADGGPELDRMTAGIILIICMIFCTALGIMIDFFKEK